MRTGFNAMFDTRFLVCLLALNLSQLCLIAKDSSATERNELILIDGPGALDAGPTDLNDRGEIVGLCGSLPGVSQTFRWTESSGAQVLTTNPVIGEADIPYINASGMIALSGSVSGTGHAFRYDDRNGLRDLGTLGFGSYTTAINSKGDVAGYSYTSGRFSHAFIWTEKTGMQDLGTLGGSTSAATSINDRGEVTGTAASADGSNHAFLWSKSAGMKDLGVPAGYVHSAAAGINQRGEIYGTIRKPNTLLAFYWSESTGFIVIQPNGRLISRPLGMTSRGEIVLSDALGHVFFWSARDGFTDIGTLGGNETHASGMNDHGEVVGYSTVSTGAIHSFLWTPFGPKARVMMDLGDTCMAVNISNSGIIAGFANIPPHQRLCIWNTPSRP